MCKLQEYNSLDLHQRAIILGNPAIFLVNLDEPGVSYSLYAYHNYYIEVCIDENTNGLIDIIAFEYSERLDKYLDTIVFS